MKLGNAVVVRTFKAREVRKRKVKATATAAPVYQTKCGVCGKQSQRSAANGMTLWHCRSCQEKFRRHGSHWHKSYTATELRPYLKAATGWLKENRDDLWVSHTVTATTDLLQTSGHAEPATSLRGLSPRDRARIALARLRDAGIKAERLLAIALAVAAIHEEEPTSPHKREFRQVQIAKAAHRLASGYHREYEWPLKDGQKGIYAIHAYARSTGRVLRWLGKAIEEACDHVIGQHLAAFVAFKVERFGHHPGLAAPKRT
jgi:ribosomal protein L37AE/L43A